MTWTRIATASLLVAGAVTLVVAQPASVEQSMSRAARALLATLDPPQVDKIKFAFNAEERFNWHYIPRTRLGLPFKEMTEKQRDAAFALIKVGLSQKGFTKTETIRSFEPILKA